jgi:hypothetical protein
VALAIRQDIAGNLHCQQLIERLTREGRSYVRVQCPEQRCGTEYVAYYGPVMETAEAQRLVVNHIRRKHPEHEWIITFDEDMPAEVRPLFE